MATPDTNDEALHTMDQKKLGLIVNPIAGMGGSVGLKGTDGEAYEEALKLGAEPVTPDRTRAFLAHIRRQAGIEWAAAPHSMGGDYLQEQGLHYQVIGEADRETSAGDTQRISRLMIEAGIDLLVFVGGDGTARDVYDVVGAEIPVVGVPGGVKILSTVFAVSPRAAARMIDAFVEGSGTTEEEVLDIDEEAYRGDQLASRLYGAMRVPNVPASLQPAKVASSAGASPEAQKRDIAAHVVERMDPDTLYLLGPGTTVKAITNELGLAKTILGIDALLNGELIGKDLNEAQILTLLSQHPQRVIIVTPIGGSGFIFGRGSKPFTPDVLRQVGLENITVIGTPQKIRDLKCLRVDTGDLELDEALSGYREVIIGDREARMAKVSC